MIEPTKFRWSRVYESTEEELLVILQKHGVHYERWAAEEFHEFTEIIFDEETSLYCVEGSIEFEIIGKNIALQAGDGLTIPAGLSFNALAGFAGCVCYEVTSSISQSSVDNKTS